MQEQIRDILLGLKEIWDEPVARLLPAHLAFFTVLSIVPIMIIIFFAAQSLSLPIDSLMKPLESVLPDAVSSVLSPTEDKASSSGVGIWIIVALFIGSNGMHSLIIGSNSLYGFESNNYVLRRLKALLLTLLLVILVLVGTAIIGGSEYLLGIIPGDIHVLANIIRWTLITLFIFATVKYLYMVTPHMKLQSRFTNIGSLFTSLGFLVASFGFTFYYTHFSSYHALYDSLANIIILMVWVYIMAFVFVGGMIINVFQYRRHRSK